MTHTIAMLLALGLAVLVGQSLGRSPLGGRSSALAVAVLYGTAAMLSYGAALWWLPAHYGLGFYLLICAVLWRSGLELEQFLLRLVGPQRESLRASVLLGLPVTATLGHYLWQHMALRLGYGDPKPWRGIVGTAGFWVTWLWLASYLMPLTWVLTGLLYSLLCYSVCFAFSAVLVVQFWLAARALPRAQ